MVEYITSHLTYHDNTAKRAYSFNIKIYHLVLNEEEKELANKIVQDEKLNKALWDGLAGIFSDFESETKLKAYVLGKNRGHLILKNNDTDGMPIYTAKELAEMTEDQISVIYNNLMRFKKLYEDMFVIFRQRIKELQK